jgi:hypothetical protein
MSLEIFIENTDLEEEEILKLLNFAKIKKIFHFKNKLGTFNTKVKLKNEVNLKEKILKIKLNETTKIQILKEKEIINEVNKSYIHLEKKNLLSRILYTNPVCLLTSFSSEEKKQNVMAITWLTPINNNANFFISINKKRFTSNIIIKEKKFILNIPIKGMEEKIKCIIYYYFSNWKNFW